MATIKSFTDLSQSKTLSKILPLESADMHYKVNRHNNESKIFMIPYSELGHYKDNDYQYCVCAWSLAALLDVIPCGQVNRMANSDKWEASSWNNSDFEPAYYVEDYGNPIDACVAMIERLHELKML